MYSHLKTNDHHKQQLQQVMHQFTLNGLSAVDYPQYQKSKNHVITIPVPLFEPVIVQTAVAVSTAESLGPILTGIQW